MSKLIYVDKLKKDILALPNCYNGFSDTFDKACIIGVIDEQPTIEERKWIPCSERVPDDLSEVNITWINTDPEPYYDFVKNKPATGTAVYYKGDWYWYSSVTQDVLAEYGKMDSEKLDDAIRVIAWMPLPDPYVERGTDESIHGK